MGNVYWYEYELLSSDYYSTDTWVAYRFVKGNLVTELWMMNSHRCLIFMLTKINHHTTITAKKATLLLYHTTGFDRLSGHHQVYIYNIKNIKHKNKMVKTMSNITIIQNT
jgi:hypothetical protein